MELEEVPASHPVDGLQPTATQDETRLPGPLIVARAQFHAFRLICGASYFRRDDGVSFEIRSGSTYFWVTAEAFDGYQRIANRVQKEVIELRGLSVPFNAEDTIRIINSSNRIALQEFGFEPKVLRVYFLRNNSQGVGFYRTVQPVNWINKTCAGVISATEEAFLRADVCAAFDVIVAPRVSNERTIEILKEVKRSGRAIVYETDDYLDAVPEWNPNFQASIQGTDNRAAALDLASAVIVSTEELKEYMGRQADTFICHNGIDASLWPMKVQPQSNQNVVRIAWAGTETHEKDLGLITETIRFLIKKYGKRVEFCFVHYVHPSLSRRVNGNVVPALDVQNNMKLFPGCAVEKWPKHLASQNFDIMLAPLVENEFNKAKSELKVLESWALGIPIVASKIAPYERAIDNGRNGLLCKPSPLEWADAISLLIDDAELRERIASAGLKTLTERYLMPKIAREYETALLKIGLAHVTRVECRDNIQARLEQIERGEKNETVLDIVDPADGRLSTAEVPAG